MFSGAVMCKAQRKAGEGPSNGKVLANDKGVVSRSKKEPRITEGKLSTKEPSARSAERTARQSSETGSTVKTSSVPQSHATENKLSSPNNNQPLPKETCKGE
ncbi:hypothetical protein Tcan_00158 [Toxocara canis]|uniref:Uncharacterized protein n=1 Tax=Toxocara canis TaxID=6265 RepID=A0A0B2W2Y4_TOXCA|nr:hypothetical protein Tcan_00158 [Toxocara canis]